MARKENPEQAHLMLIEDYGINMQWNDFKYFMPIIGTLITEVAPSYYGFTEKGKGLYKEVYGQLHKD